MTASDLAQILDARRAGAGKWQARCPAHSDRSPSLSIGEGKDGRILLHCFAGCTVREILAAQKLASRDLFAGPPQSRWQAQRAAQERALRDAEATARRVGRGALADRYRKLTILVEFVGDRLARLPENAPGENTMTRLFHEALSIQRDVQAKLEATR